MINDEFIVKLECIENIDSRYVVPKILIKIEMKKNEINEFENIIKEYIEGLLNGIYFSEILTYGGIAPAVWITKCFNFIQKNINNKFGDKIIKLNIDGIDDIYGKFYNQ